MAITSHTKPFQHFIGGEWVNSTDGSVFDIFNPLDDSLYGQAAKGSADDIHRAISAAKAAFPTYGTSVPMERERLLLHLDVALPERDADELHNGEGSNVYLWPGSALVCNERSAACQRPPPSSRHPPLLPPAAKPPVTGAMPPPSARRSHLPPA